MDLLTTWRWLPALMLPAAAVLVGGCGSSQTIAQRTLPPAVPVPAATTAATPPTTTKPTRTTTGSTPKTKPRPQRPRHQRVSTTVTEQRHPHESTAGSGDGRILSPAAAASFARLQSQLGGQIGLAVSGIGFEQPVETLGPVQSAVAWSTSKVPIAMAIYAAGLGQTHQQDLAAAITESDNAAAERLWDALGGGERAAQAAEAQVREAGDLTTTVQSRTLRSGYTPFGQTVWALADQTRFVAGMACLDTGSAVLELMGQVASGQRWGLGDAGVPARFKGGWGPGSQPGAGGGYLDRQTGIVTIDGMPVALSIASLPANGSHDSGTAALTAIARWAVANVNASGLPRRAVCT